MPMDKSVASQNDVPVAVKPLVLPVLKFSYATSSTERSSPLGWTHLSGGADLVVIFEHVKTTDPRTGQTQDTRYFKVQRGLEVLEELNLGSLAQEATRGSSIHSHSRSHSQPPQDLKSSIAVLVKSPCLAIRYPTHINQVRRFQVKFTSEADYYKAISILSEVGCPITESSTATGAGAGTGHPSATSYQGKPGSSGSTLMSGTASPGPASFPPPSFPDVPSVRPSSAAQIPRASSIGSTSTLSAAPPAPGSQQIQPASSTATLPAPDVQAGNDRPSTAPSFPDLASLNQILPPKRDLPFAKPASTSTVKKARRGNNNNNLTQQQQVSTTAAVSASPAKPAVSSAASAAAERSSIMPLPAARASPSTYYHRPQEASSGGIEAAYASRNQSTLAPPPQKGPATQQQQHQHQQQLYPNETAIATPRAPFTTASPAFINQLNSTPTPTTAAQPATKPPPTSIHTPTPSTPTVTTGLQQPAPPSLGLPDDHDLTTYLSTPTAERSAQLEAWMCTQLESEGFLALCRDVEGAWRRVAYGF